MKSLIFSILSTTSLLFIGCTENPNSKDSRDDNTSTKHPTNLPKDSYRSHQEKTDTAFDISDIKKSKIALAQAIREWATEDMDAAERAILRRPDGPRKKFALERLTQMRYEANGAEATLRWLNQLNATAPELHSIGQEQLIRMWFPDAPEAASDWVATHATTLHPTLVEQISESYAMIDHEQAALWAQSLPAPQKRIQALEAMLTDWAANDPAASATFINQLQGEDADHDTLVAEFTRQAVHIEPISALEWAETIQDPTLRTETMRAVFQTWQTRSPHEATEWFAQSAYDDATKAALLTR